MLIAEKEYLSPEDIELKQGLAVREAYTTNVSCRNGVQCTIVKGSQPCPLNHIIYVTP